MAEYKCSVTFEPCNVKMKIKKETRAQAKAAGAGRSPLWFAGRRMPYCTCHDELALPKNMKSLGAIVQEGRRLAGITQEPSMPTLPPPQPDPYA